MNRLTKRLRYAAIAATILAVPAGIAAAAPAHASYPNEGGTNRYVYGTHWGCWTYYGPQVGWRYSCA